MKARDLWRGSGGRAGNSPDISAVWVENARLPMKFWRTGFFFTGLPDESIHPLTEGRFPATLVPRKRRPVYSLTELPHGVGYRVCPCSSRRPFDRPRFRFIRKGCMLAYTGYEMDRNSYLVEEFSLNLPASVALSLWFKGEVPESCLISGP